MRFTASETGESLLKQASDTAFIAQVPLKIIPFLSGQRSGYFLTYTNGHVGTPPLHIENNKYNFKKEERKALVLATGSLALFLFLEVVGIP